MGGPLKRDPMPEENDSFNITRRTVIASATFVPLAALTAVAQAPATALSPGELKTLEAFIDRLPCRCRHGQNPITSLITSLNSSVPAFTAG